MAKWYSKVNPGSAVLLFLLTLFFVALTFAWLFTTPPKLTNADYFERIGWIAGLIIALYLKPPTK